MVLPGTLLDAVLLRRAPRLLVATLGVSDLPRLLSALLPVVLPLLLSMLWLLGMPWSLLTLVLPIALVPPLLLSMFRAGLCLLVFDFLLFRVTPVIVPLFVLRIQRCSDSEKQRQKACADRSTCLHMGDLHQSVRPFYCKLPVVAFTGWPMASPETRSSTLRFCWRPAALLFEATGELLP